MPGGQEGGEKTESDSLLEAAGGDGQQAGRTRHRRASSALGSFRNIGPFPYEGAGRRPSDPLPVIYGVPHIFWPTAAFVGITMLWAVEYLYVTPIYLTLGIKISDIGFVWVAGNAGIFLLTPFLGAVSDFSEHPWGKRRPFIFWAVLAALLGALTFPNAEYIGYWLGDRRGFQPCGIATAVLSLVVMEIGLDTMQSVSRTLLADLAQENQLVLGNNLFALNNGIGTLFGYGLGSVDLVSNDSFSYFKTNARAMFSIGAIVLFLGSLLTLLLSKEQQHTTLAEDQHKATFLGSWRRVINGFTTQPRAVWKAGVPQLLNYCGWSTLFYYGSDWFGSVIYGGSSDEYSDTYYLYQQGVQAASLGYLLQGVVSILFSFLLTDMCEYMGARAVWVCSLVVSAACLLSTVFMSEGEKTPALIMMAIMGFPLACTYAIPWTIVTVVVQNHEDAALFCTIFRLYEVTPFILMGVLSSILLNIVPTSDEPAFLFASAFFALSSLWVAFLLEEPPKSRSPSSSIAQPI